MDATLFTVIASVVAVGTLITLVLRGVFTLERRITALETKMEPFWEALPRLVVDTLRRIEPKGNPVTAERWQDLLAKLEADTLSLDEAKELNGYLLEQQEEARQKKDLAVLIAVGLGIALVAALIKNKKK